MQGTDFTLLVSSTLRCYSTNTENASGTSSASKPAPSPAAVPQGAEVRIPRLENIHILDGECLSTQQSTSIKRGGMQHCRAGLRRHGMRPITA